MLTIQYLINKKLPLSHVLTKEDKEALLKENAEANFSYLCLMREMFSYKTSTVATLLNGWGGVKLVKI